MGRADQTTKVRGMFVHPVQIAQIEKQFEEVLRMRLVVTSVDYQDVMTLKCETSEPSAPLAEAITNCIRDVCKLRGDIQFVEPGTIANDGVVIEDARSYE